MVSPWTLTKVFKFNLDDYMKNQPTFLFSILALFYLCGCVSFPKMDSPRNHEISKDENTRRLHHVVICWLKEEGNKLHQDKIIEVTRTFLKIPGVIHAEAGTVVGSERDIVDDSFDVGILIVTKDQASLKNYLEHPIHQKAKKEVLSPLVKRVLVYDFEK
jgi:hypothetical protein